LNGSPFRPPDGGDAGEVQQQPGGPGDGAHAPALRGEAEERGSAPQDAPAQRRAQARSGTITSAPDPDSPGSEIIMSQGSGSDMINFVSGSGSGSSPFHTKLYNML